MQSGQLAFIDYAILAIYVIFVVGIGFALKRSMKSSADFFQSGRAIPAWITGLAFISANLGALELVGMGASGAKYGIATCHFYWVGAIPGMVFLAVFMMPFYYGSKARSVPEYLKLRFDERTRCLNSISFAVMTLMASGISMHMLAKLLHELLHWDYNVSLWVCSAVVLVYVLKGGLTSAIYTEVLQFCMIVLGFAPVVYLGMKDIGRLVEPARCADARGAASRRSERRHQCPSDVRSQRLDQRLATAAGGAVAQSDGCRRVRDGIRAGVRARLRLLVYELPRGAAGHGCPQHDGGPPHAADRRGAQDALARAGHSARHARDRLDVRHRRASTTCRTRN